MRRLLIVSFVPVAAIGIALARGRRNEPPPEAPLPPAVAEPAEEPPPAPPPPPAAPPLFPDGLPVAVTTLPAGLSSLSAQSCNACHWGAHDGWSAGAHSRAGQSATFRSAVRAAGDSTACTQCHLPLASQHAELAAGYVDGDITHPRMEPNPSFDPTLRGEGVTCAACHVRGDTVVGTRASEAAPHGVAVSAELADGSTVCAACHELTWPNAPEPFYATWSEWKSSAYAQAGVSCVMCHMPPMGAQAPGAAGGVASHAVTADLRRALSALLKFERGSATRGQPLDVTLTLQNTGAGHHVPTGNPHGALRVDVVLLDAAGKELAPAFSTTLKRTVETAPPWKTLADTRLPAGGQLQASHVFTPSAKGGAGWGAFEVRAVKDGVVTVLSRVPVEVR